MSNTNTSTSGIHLIVHLGITCRPRINCIMVKNTQSSRDSNKAKPRAGPSQDVDTSYIVFGDSAGDSKKSKKQSGGTAAEQTDRKGKGKDVTESNGAADAANKPTARALIGGASWTGKLPVNMLSEHCQKQKWEKPEYTMVVIQSCGV